MALDRKIAYINLSTGKIETRPIPIEIRKKFLNNMSQNRAEDILDILDMKPRVTLREINEARSKIVQVARVLEEENQILFKKEKEEYIE